MFQITDVGSPFCLTCRHHTHPHKEIHPPLSPVNPMYSTHEFSKEDVPATKPFNLHETQQHPYPGSSQGESQEHPSSGSSHVEISVTRSHSFPEQEHPSSAGSSRKQVPPQSPLTSTNRSTGRYQRTESGIFQVGDAWRMSSLER